MTSTPLLRSAHYFLSMLVVSALAAGGCVAATPDDDLDDEDAEMWDEGPPDGSGEEAGASTSGVGNMPAFQLPFPCGQVWSGQTRTNHSPINAVDFNRADDLGDRVVAAAAGKVSRVANEGNTSYGRWIEIDHGNGYRTRYAHLSLQSVSVGQQVAQGQKIGEVGNTGGSSGAHLHYEQRLNGAAVKPVFNGATALFYGTRSYTSKNGCAPGGGGGGVTGTVNTSGISLTIRAEPTTSAEAVGSVADGAKVTITCQVKGSQVTGTYGTSTLWDFIGSGYVSDAYVATGSDGQVAPTCK